jgi:NADPH-dependent 2,4-dienoyl-CoA reductase/sulfur reductase-like enzyme/nitrite reductase/ring-hydroxylating ferredoxin subunit
MSTFTFAADAVADGAMKTFEHGKRKILVVRNRDDYRAFDARCPHAGADLGEGVLCAGRLICPWHHSTFDASSGALLEPLATEGLTRYVLHREGDRCVVDPDATLSRPTPPRLGRGQHVVIVGAGGGGFMAAHTLRQHGFDGRVTLVDPDHAAPYERPLLSKMFLSGEMGAGEVGIGGKHWEKNQRIQRRYSRAISVKAGKRQLVLERGNPLDYDHLIVATGSQPRTADLPGADLPGVYMLRSLDDAKALKKAARGKHVVIVGSSFIGMEAAASLLGDKGARSVVVVGKADEVLQPMLGANTARELRRLHESHGVTFHLGSDVAMLTGDSRVEGVELADGSIIKAQVVLLGLGVTPRSELLKDFVDDDGAVPVDQHMHVTDDIYAVGDIALAPTVLGPQRIEHWRVAMQHGMVAALAVLGEPGVGVDRRVPFFWTDQFGKSLLYVGHASKKATRHVWGDPSKLDFIEFRFDGGRTVAAAGMQRDAEMDAFELLLKMGRAPSPAEIRRGGFDLVDRLEGASKAASNR